MNKYILGLTPIFLTALSLLVLNIMLETGKSFPHSLVGPLGTIVPDLEIFVQMFAYLIAPVCIFVFFIFIGDVMNRPEIWTGAALALTLSAIGGLVYMGISTASTSYLFDLFKSIAYLIQYFSVIAALIVLTGIELFRRSIVYTITRDVVIITGGLWHLTENVVPLNQIEKLVLVQGPLGHIFHFGTVVPAGLVLGIAQIDMRGHHTKGDMVYPDTDQASTLRWKQGAHNPLICLYGLRDPEIVKERIEKAIRQISEKSN